MKPIERWSLPNGDIVEIIPDNDPPHPREWDNVGTIYHVHSRYDLGVRVDDPRDTVEEAEEDGEVYLPVYMYEHSGIALSTGSFTDPWDSGQVGVVVAHKADVEKCMGGDATKEQIEKALRAEIETYSKFLNGDCYGWRLMADSEPCDKCGRSDGPIEKDSCWGYYGIDDARDEAFANAGVDPKNATELD